MGKQRDLFGGDDGDIKKDGNYYADRDGMRAQNAQDRKVQNKVWNKEYKKCIVKFMRTFPGLNMTSEDVGNWMRAEGIELPGEGRAVGPTWALSQESVKNTKAGRPAIVRFVVAVKYINPNCHKGWTSRYEPIPENIPAYIAYWGLD